MELRLVKNGFLWNGSLSSEPVRVDDIQTDPLWEDYKELGAKFGLRSCWSVPIRSSNGVETAILGTFALYARNSAS